jgi:hypothetical protein
MSFEFTGAFGIPGIAAALETVENVFWWGRFENNQYVGAVIEGAARDTGNTGYTDVLRPGLLLGQLTTGEKYTEWDPTATDGSQMIKGVLAYAQKMQRLGSNADRWVGWIMVGGNIKADRLLIPGQTAYTIAGNANEHLIRAQMFGRFLFSDRLQGSRMGGWSNIVIKTADYTVTEADNDTLFTNRGDAGAINFTLPTTAEKGLHYGFYCVADQNMTVTSGTADTLVCFNDATADSITLSTSSEKIGGMFEVYGDGTGWLTKTSLAADSQTVTIAT